MKAPPAGWLDERHRYFRLNLIRGAASMASFVLLAIALALPAD
ncbi:MAG: hypothetical protein ACRDYU_15765 [Actinomycetes bacterium]